MGLCIPCYDFGGWENTHSDNAHESIKNGGADAAEFSGGQESIDSITAEMKHCWVCHPELDESAETYVPRAGTSRKGIVLNVKNGQTGAEKAREVREILKNRKGIATSVSTARRGEVNLTISSATFKIELAWNNKGQYLYPSTSYVANGRSRKVRNVSEALRLIG